MASQIIKATKKPFVTVGFSQADYICNGVSDNVTINRAISDIAALGGGKVFIKRGSYDISARIIPLSNVEIQGEGMFVTRLVANSSLNRGILDNKTEYDTSNPYENGIISDLELDGTNMNPANEIKGFNSDSLNNCKVMRVYAHDTNATGIGPDDFYGSTISECIVVNCGYMNKKTLTAATWSTNQIVFTTSAAHGYSINDVVIVTGMIPTPYNGRYVISAVTSTTFTVTSTFLDIDPGTATTFGISSDSLIGHNGIGIASGANTHEATIVTNNICIGNQNNNFLIEADTTFTDANASYIFANNISIEAGQVGFLNTGTPNTQFINNYDFGSQFGCQVSPVTQVRSISAASWSSGTITFTLSSAFTTDIHIGDSIDINGMTPTAYNGYYRITSVISNSQFTVALASDPGSSSVFGTATRVAHETDDTLIENNIFSNNVLYGIRVVQRADKFKISGNTIKESYNYGVGALASFGNITDNFIYGNGRDGIDIETGSGTHTPVSNIIVTNNHIYNNGTRATYDGIEIQSASTDAPVTDISINNNQIFDNQQTKTQRYGIILRVAGILSNISVLNNNLSGNATAGILKQSTEPTISIKNNTGFNPEYIYSLGNVSGSTTFNRQNGSVQVATLTGNVTAVITNGVAYGDELSLILTQDGTGSRTISWPANVKLAQTSVGLILSTAASSVDTVTFTWNGTDWVEKSRALATTKLSIREGLTVTAPSGSNLVGLTVTQSDTTNNPNLATLTNSGTGNGILMSQNGVLASTKYGLFVDSNAVQTNSELVRIRQQNASSTKGNLLLSNSGTGQTLTLDSTAGTAASGILFGTDTNLYRSGADLLKTDDNIVVGTRLSLGADPVTASPFNVYRFQVADDAGTNSGALFRVGSQSSVSITAANSGGTIASPTTSNLSIGALAIRSFGYGSTTYKESARILMGLDESANGANTPTDTSMPGQIVFYTVPDGSTTVTERLRITNSGKVGVAVNHPTSMFQLDGSFALKSQTKTANYTLAEDYCILGDATAGAITLTLPAATAGRIYVIKKIDSTTNAVNIATTSSQTIDGSSSIAITVPNTSLTIMANGVGGAWFII